MSDKTFNSANSYDSEAIMGLGRTFYQVSEDVGVVEVCAIVYRPNGNLDCPITFPFDVSLSTGDDSAGIPTALLYVYMMTDVLHSSAVYSIGDA